MSWKKRQWSWKDGWSEIRKSFLKSRSGLRSRNSGNQSINATDTKAFAEDAEEDFFATFAAAFAFFAFKSCLHFAAYCLLPIAFWINACPHGRATAPGVLAKSNRITAGSTFSIAFTFAVAFAHAAAESASVGRGDFVSRVAV